MNDSTSFNCPKCDKDFFTWDSCIQNGTIIECPHCKTKFRIDLVEVTEHIAGKIYLPEQAKP